jgi:predicted N-acetyltransferase YhbS
MMVGMREKVEREFPGYHSGAGRLPVDQIRHRRRHLVGDWFLALLDGLVAGGIGLLVFETGAGRVGRLQDVDIAPGFRGRGLGRELLWGVCEVAGNLGLEALWLRADADEWPKDWYGRFGFASVGAWTSFAVRKQAGPPGSGSGGG